MWALQRALLCLAIWHHAGLAQPTANRPAADIPRVWDDAELTAWTIPARTPGVYTVHMPSALYYQIRVAAVYKSYPIYHPAKEPRGYMDWLRQQEPKIVFDPSKLHSQADWEAVGNLVFIDPYPASESIERFRDPRWYTDLNIPLSSEGIVPAWRYLILKRGEVRAGSANCAACHSRVMPDGSLINGPQTNVPIERDFAWDIRRRRVLSEARDKLANPAALLFPSWKNKVPLADGVGEMDVDQIARLHDAIPPGVNIRIGVSVFTPPKVADLIGVKDRKYLDLIARVRHRNIGDLMRYAALGFGTFAFYADRPDVPPSMMPQPSALERYSDEQLYALALYVYSLQPPPNPNRFDAVAARGQIVFKREGCEGCHTPPLYTNNKLTLAGDFEPPKSHLAKYDSLPIRVGTDSRAAMQPMRGTGYYKVPSLKGVWYRGPLEHNGSVATLEDWFDPARLRDDYVPTGFKGYSVTTRAVKGHEFGLKLSSEDKLALIKFLKTL